MKQAIQECELRWFHETAALAKEGEANQMALLGHMYSVGYGCKPDNEQASKWFAEASKRLGYNVLTDQPPLMSCVGPAQQQQPAAAAGAGSSGNGSSRPQRPLQSSGGGCGGAGNSSNAGGLTPPPPAVVATAASTAQF